MPERSRSPHDYKYGVRNTLVLAKGILIHTFV